jgi:hypothetical protein
VVITTDWLNAKGTDPQGLNLYQLGQDFSALTGKANPIPAPAPQPTPAPTPSPVPSSVDSTLAAAMHTWLTAKGL